MDSNTNFGSVTKIAPQKVGDSMPDGAVTSQKEKASDGMTS